MTESEIMKALECCAESHCKKECAYFGESRCNDLLILDTLSLINRKNDSIEMYRRNIALLDEQILAKDKEIEELAYKLECLLCTVTGNKLSKSTYDLRTMESYANDFLQERCRK